MRERQPEHPHTDIPISIKTWYQLLDGSFKSAYAKEDWEIATEAIDEWVRRHNPDAIPLPAAAGYQWKSQFLPTGTLVRTVFGGKNHHCTVEGDQILYNGKPVSPSAAALSTPSAAYGAMPGAAPGFFSPIPRTGNWPTPCAPAPVRTARANQLPTRRRRTLAQLPRERPSRL